MVPGNVGIGFAIPSNTARKVLPDLMEHGKVARGWLGVMIEDLSPNMREFYGAKDGGALVTGIQPEAPAAKSDLKEDDTIVGVDGQPVKDTWDLQKAVSERKPGDTVKLDILRGKKRAQVDLKLGTMPEKYAGLEAPKPAPEEPATASALGLKVAEITPDMASNLGLPRKRGVVVLKVDADSPAAGKVDRGDVITRVNDAVVRSLDDYQQAIDQAKKQHAKFVILRTERRGEDGEVLRGVTDVPTEW
jgi:serine protease Do